MNVLLFVVFHLKYKNIYYLSYACNYFFQVYQHQAFEWSVQMQNIISLGQCVNLHASIEGTHQLGSWCLHVLTRVTVYLKICRTCLDMDLCCYVQAWKHQAIFKSTMFFDDFSLIFLCEWLGIVCLTNGRLSVVGVHVGSFHCAWQIWLSLY